MEYYNKEVVERVYYKTGRAGCCGQIKLVHEQNFSYIGSQQVHEAMMRMAEDNVAGKDDGWRYIIRDAETGKRLFDLMQDDDDSWTYKDTERAVKKDDYREIFLNTQPRKEPVHPIPVPSPKKILHGIQIFWMNK